MKIAKWLVPFGMIGVVSFFLLDILGKMLWPAYNPVTTYVSALVANEAPHVHFMRFFLNTYTVCFLLFSFGMTVLSYAVHSVCIKIGYIVMLATALITAVGFGAYPISIDIIFSKNDIIHVVVTITMLSATVLSMLLITVGYLKQKKLNGLGRISLFLYILYVGFNLWHLYAILNGMQILGLIQRLTFYTFHALTVTLSWAYTFGKSELITTIYKKSKKVLS